MTRDRSQEKFVVANVANALVVGGGHGIGLAVVEHLLASTSAKVIATYRSKDRALGLFDLGQREPDRLTVLRFDPIAIDAYESLAEGIERLTSRLDLTMNCIGALHGETLAPEKNLSQITSQGLVEAFRVNAVVTPMLAKSLLKFHKHDGLSVFAALSAKVGSIEDNRLGGWYGYRASKAALNMFVKNIALEFGRYRAPTIVLSLHPGTTRTELSEPFLSQTKHQIHSPLETADNLMKTLDGLQLADTGRFLSWDGATLPW